MPACADINESVQSLTGIKYETSAQHNESSTARQVRDTNDTLSLIHYLRNSGKAGKAVDEYTFKKADQAVILASHSTVKVKGVSVRVDPQSIFQRLVTIGEHSEDHLMPLFQYELCSYPPTLFESSQLHLQANKAVFGDVLWKDIKAEEQLPTGEVQYVLDGGALLCRLPWPRGSTYDSLCQQYVRYVTQKY